VITGTDLSQAVGLTESQIGIACGGEDTVLPDGMTRPDAWPCED
jgi:hypothetical protein